MKISPKVQEYTLLVYSTPPSILTIKSTLIFQSILDCIWYISMYNINIRSFKYCILKILLRFHLTESFFFLVPFSLTISLKLVIFSNLNMNNNYLLYNTELYQVYDSQIHFSSFSKQLKHSNTFSAPGKLQFPFFFPFSCSKRPRQKCWQLHITGLKLSFCEWVRPSV